MGEFLGELRVIHVTTVPDALGFLNGHGGYVRARGLVFHAISSPGDRLNEFGAREGVAVHAVEMTRRITPLRDLVALWRLWILFRRLRPHIVHAHTPKGGLLGTIAAWMARVPVRLYTIHGLAHMSAIGARRNLLMWTESISCRLADQVYCVSHSIRDVAVDEGICPHEKADVLMRGSSNGVDACGRFSPCKNSEEIRQSVRAKHGIPVGSLVVGFAGRIVRDKGLFELTEAWRDLRKEFPSLHLLIAGVFEAQDPVAAEVEKILRTDGRIHLTGHVEDLAPLYLAMDIVALPTYREGFPKVLLEAAAMCLPVVATRIPGCVDAVVDGETGILIPVHDGVALSQAIRRYLHDPELRRRHGLAGRERALREFRPEAIWEAMYQKYVHLLRLKGIPIPEAPADPGPLPSTPTGLPAAGREYPGL